MKPNGSVINKNTDILRTIRISTNIDKTCSTYPKENLSVSTVIFFIKSEEFLLKKNLFF